MIVPKLDSWLLTLEVAAAQPPCVWADLHANSRAHAAAITAAQYRLVVFPELSLTGYDLNAPVVATSHPAIAPIIAACEATDSIALVGAPILDNDGRHYLATMRVTAEGADVVYRKTWLGNEESARFSSGHGVVAIEVDGWILGLGICKDNGAPGHRAQVASLGVDVYATGLVHRSTELSMQDDWGLSIARQCNTYVIFASFAGPAGGGYDATAGSSTIWAPSGTILAKAGEEPGDLARAVLLKT